MKKITKDNYFEIMAKVDVGSLPKDYQEGHQLVIDATQNGQTWQAYDTSREIANIFDAFFERLSEHLNVQPVKPQPKTQVNRNPIQRGNVQPRAQKPLKKPEKRAKRIHLQERIPDEIKFMRRFLNLEGKVHSSDKLLRFINSLQKAMIEQRIRKTSANAEHVLYIQDSLLKVYNEMGSSVQIKIRPETVESFRNIVGVERVYPSVQYIKRFIGLHGKPLAKEKAAQLLKNIEWAVKKNILSSIDPYWDEIEDITNRLAAFTSKKSKERSIEIEKALLSGLNGIVQTCGCHSINGIDFDGSDDETMLMNSLDFTQMEFDSIGLTGKWLDLIGDPSPGFTAMVFGKPKTGKSYLCIDFAGYLARNHGKVLYVAREEGLEATLQQKLRDKAVAHSNLDVSGQLPASFDGYDFVFLDSVNKLGLEPEQLEMLQDENPETSFIYVFQTTKLGNFRGQNAFQHDVDVVIEVPEKGRAIQFGRFNQGGEMNIFDH